LKLHFFGLSLDALHSCPDIYTLSAFRFGAREAKGEGEQCLVRYLSSGVYMLVKMRR
jgi:hypothetical protein